MGCIKRRYSCRQTREMQFRSANCPRYGAKHKVEFVPTKSRSGGG